MLTTLQNKQFEIWTLPNCTACDSAKQLMTEYKINYTAHSIDDAQAKELFFMRFPGVRSVPQIVVNGVKIGGLKELKKYLDDNIKTTKVV